MEDGFYWVIMNGSKKLTIGQLDQEFSKYKPWGIIGCDEIIADDELQVIEKIEQKILKGESNGTMGVCKR